MIQHLQQQLKSVAILGLFLFVGGIIPHPVSAATVYLKADYTTIAVGDTILLHAVMDTGEKNPNTIDGEVLLKNGNDSLEITDFSVADSVLTNWLKTPSFDDGSKVSFAGGVPGGFNKKDALLFTIVLLAKSPGQVVFTPSDIQAFDNDGKATVMNVSGTPLTITVGPKGSGAEKNQWRDIVSTDNEPPRDLSVAIGRDDSVFDGKKFMTISAVDTESGIAYFEVAEGNQPAFRTGSTYVLLDQSESTPLLVTAFDKAGNKKIVLLHPDTRMDSRWFLLIAAVLLGTGILFWRRFTLNRTFPFIRKKNV